MAKLRTYSFTGSHSTVPNEQRHDWSEVEQQFTGIKLCGTRQSGAVVVVMVLMDNTHPSHIDVEVVETVGKFTRVRFPESADGVWCTWNTKPYVSKRHGTYCNTWGYYPGPLAKHILNIQQEDGKLYGWVLTKDLVQ